MTQAVHPAARDVGRHSADARRRSREARADPLLEQAIDLFATLERPQEGSEGSDVDAERAEPDKVRHDAGELGRDHAQNLASLGDLDSEQPLGSQGKCDVVADRVEIILAIGPANYLVVLPVFADLLEAAVQISDVRNAADNGFSVEL